MFWKLAQSFKNNFWQLIEKTGYIWLLKKEMYQSERAQSNKRKRSGLSYALTNINVCPQNKASGDRSSDLNPLQPKEGAIQFLNSILQIQTTKLKIKSLIFLQIKWSRFITENDIRKWLSHPRERWWMLGFVAGIYKGVDLGF